MSRKLAILLVAFAIAAVALAQEENARQRKRELALYAALESVPESARALKNPFEGDQREVPAGGKLFGRHCAECHGEKAGGTRRGPSLLRPEVREAASGTLFWFITNGETRHGMPVWSKLPEQQRWQIVTFLESLHGANGTVSPK